MPVRARVHRPVGAAPDEVRRRTHVARGGDARGDDRERRARDDLDEVRRGADEVHRHRAGRVVRGQADGRRIGRPAREVIRRAGHDRHQRGERRRRRWIDDPQPAADDVAGAQRRAVGEGQVRPEGEDDPSPVLLDPPRLRERGPQLEVGIERGQRLVELGDDGRGPAIALGGRIERGGLDPPGSGRCGRTRRRSARTGRSRRRSPRPVRHRRRPIGHGNGASAGV